MSARGEVNVWWRSISEWGRRRIYRDFFSPADAVPKDIVHPWNEWWDCLPDDRAEYIYRRVVDH